MLLLIPNIALCVVAAEVIHLYQNPAEFYHFIDSCYGLIQYVWKWITAWVRFVQVLDVVTAGYEKVLAKLLKLLSRAIIMSS
ncbi:hypothetical protein F5Y13DRAFT_161008 [Hypoxylon sp. FL1857]|nr:hypothetical protein F5Y13DRAFT_161008 [Hypoxylon sp. FL1857]